jgi:hypothetical protein
MSPITVKFMILIQQKKNRIPLDTNYQILENK